MQKNSLLRSSYLSALLMHTRIRVYVTVIVRLYRVRVPIAVSIGRAD